MVAERDQPLEKARALAREALAGWRGADPDQAVESCDHALALLLPIGPTDALADVLRWKGSILRDRGLHAAASDLYSQSLAVADAISYKAGRAHALNCMGTIAQFRGDLPTAERWYGEAARLAHRLGDRRLSGMVQQNLGIVAESQDRTDEAVAHFRLALAAFEQEEQNDAVLWVLNNLGVLYTREAAYGRAGEVLDRARQLAVSLKDIASEAIVEENRAALALATGRLDDAESCAKRAYALAESRHDDTRRAAAFRLLARVAAERDKVSRHAIVLFERALSLSELGEDVQLRAEILSDLGDIYDARAETPKAKEYWRRALELARLAGFVTMIGRLQTRIRPGSHDRVSGPKEVTLQ
ncbi:MAG TPA: tetratricopeptide repeat protein [Gemmatimonadaceae bacterium]|nr:tetratricopeptide repeat protein [Gemmatimonadaceae bacterium]